MSQLGYPYAEGNRLNDRNTYFYTPAVGAPMVQAWRASRDAVLAELPQPAAQPSEFPVTSTSQLPENGAVVTADLLEQLMAELQKSDQSGKAGFWLDRLVHKFETTKYLHRAYDKNFRAIDRTKREDLDLYVRFAEVLVISFQADGKLPKLNALLKVIDTLCSVRSQLSTDLQRRLAGLIQNEEGITAKLAG
ncbi:MULTISPECIES: hypothetical protein [Falsihalocynthiibacter]|uniref:hypothetical protein n=1 Tax=Falsihalocynthiibacter TaxID=2854182 RepID=UPI0030010ADA